VGSVGHAYAVLRGRLTGDQDEASNFLDSLSDSERTLRNRKEGRVRKKLRKTGYKLGSRVR
jgi:hypothetical protein